MWNSVFNLVTECMAKLPNKQNSSNDDNEKVCINKKRKILL